jgi:uridine kinase
VLPLRLFQEVPWALVMCGMPCTSLPRISELLTLRVYVDMPLDLCLVRLLGRDATERHGSVSKTLERYVRQVRPMYLVHVAPGRRLADVIVPGNWGSPEALRHAVATVWDALPARRP